MRKIALLLCPFLLLSLAVRHGVGLRYPAHFPPPVYDFSGNPLSEEGIQLGRALFYDPLLSQDQSISCASCHSSYNAFAHTDHALSHGIYDSIGLRNAPALMNLAWQPYFMWDGAIHHLDMQALAPLESPSEMGEDLVRVIAKLRSSEMYRRMFRAAYGDSAITGERFLKALSQFQLTLVSGGARYDRMREGLLDFSPQEKSGHQLFRAHCERCHAEPLFSNYAFASNGLPPDSMLQDAGRYRVTRVPADRLLFKTPTLRNLAYTYPYMHDGRFRTLRQVLDHYAQATLPGSPAPIRLDAAQKADLLAFLRTLNDSSFVFEPGFQFPSSLLLER
jgi:cytochrome c peroxidase